MKDKKKKTSIGLQVNTHIRSGLNTQGGWSGGGTGGNGPQ